MGWATNPGLTCMECTYLQSTWHLWVAAMFQQVLSSNLLEFAIIQKNPCSVTLQVHGPLLPSNVNLERIL